MVNKYEAHESGMKPVVWVRHDPAQIIGPGSDRKLGTVG
jgi:hypothetical protein